MDKYTGSSDVTELLLKKALNTIKSIKKIHLYKSSLNFHWQMLELRQAFENFDISLQN